MPVDLLALTKYGDRAASARQRYLQFRGHLRCRGVTLSVRPLYDNRYLDATFSGEKASRPRVAARYAQRFASLVGEKAADAIWVQYELFPFLPALFDLAVLRRHVPVILDYDDAIFHQYDQHRSRVVRALLGGKLKPLLRRADLAICGNAYLHNYAAKYCSRTEIVPTVVDTDIYKPEPSPRVERPMTVGWIGSPSTFEFVKPIIPVLSDLAERHDLRIRIVGAGPQPSQPPRSEFLPWSEAAEISLIQDMDIGIMPLPDEPWARGKCGYKLIQYMACGLPVIASPVGVNSEIVEHGVNGFLATTPEEWVRAIVTLAGSAPMRASMGALGRRKVEHEYSLAVHGPRLAEIVRGVIDEGRSRGNRAGS